MAVYFEDFQVGQEWTSPTRTITEADVTMFAMLSGDYDEIHTSEHWAREHSAYKTRIAHGMLGMCIIEGLKKRIAAATDAKVKTQLEDELKQQEEYLAEIIPAPEFGGSFIHDAPGLSYGLDVNFKF